MTHVETGGGHGHSAHNIGEALAMAVRYALHGITHSKVIVVVTGISKNGEEYDIDVECILIDEDNENLDEESQELAEKVSSDFYKSELNVENEQDGERHVFYEELERSFKRILENLEHNFTTTEYKILFTKEVIEEEKFVFPAWIEKNDLESLKSTYDSYSNNFDPVPE